MTQPGFALRSANPLGKRVVAALAGTVLQANKCNFCGLPAGFVEFGLSMNMYNGIMRSALFMQTPCRNW